MTDKEEWMNNGDYDIGDLLAVEPKPRAFLEWAVEPCSRHECSEWRLSVEPIPEPVFGWWAAEFVVHGDARQEIYAENLRDRSLEVRRWLERIHAEH